VREIPGFPGYCATEDGEIVSLRVSPPRVLSKQHLPEDYGRGYYYVNVKTGSGRASRRLVLVHRLVLLAYHGDPPDGHQARHLNGNSLDNRIENLAWGTASENVLDQRRHGTAAYDRCGEEANGSRLTEPQVREIERRGRSGESALALAAEFGVTRRHVYDIVRHETWKNLWGGARGGWGSNLYRGGRRDRGAVEKFRGQVSIGGFTWRP
jgi:hypothetical protein